MTFKDVFPDVHFSGALKDVPIKGVSRDTRTFSRGDIFFVIEGDSFDIFSHLKDIENDAAAFVANDARRGLVSSIIRNKPVIFVPDVGRELKRCAAILYPLNMNKFKVIGVTGTNGKTTVTRLIHYLLSNLMVKSVLIGTINYLIGDEVLKAPYTTPDYLSLRKILFAAQNKNIKYIIMEVSSHSIEQKRIEGIKFTQCIFTNLSRDHLDYHLTMDEYFSVKERLFTNNPSSTAIVNIDNSYGEFLFSRIEGEKYSYGFNDNAYYRTIEYQLRKRGVKFTFSLKNGHMFNVSSSLIGRHNIANILSSLASIDKLGFSLDKSVKFISSFKGIDGRLEEVAKDMFVDYAHTDDALDNALRALRDSGYDNVILVFGCGGDRDRGKRKKMGEVASSKATFSFITSDNPRSENPDDICYDIEKGFSGKNYRIIVDRGEAISEAIKLKNDYDNCALLVAGKGHEEYQIIGNKKIPFKDKAVIIQILNTADSRGSSL